MLNKKQIIRYIYLFIAIIIIVVGLVSYTLYGRIFANNINTNIKKSFFLYIPSNAKFNAVLDSLKKHNVLIDVENFIWVSEKKNYIKNVKSGRYRISACMNNNSLVNMLRSGNQQAINVTFNNIRTKADLAGKIARQLECDSISLMKLLNDKTFLKKYGFTPTTVISMFIPNTYQFYWNTNPDKFFKKMNKEYDKFWNTKRLSRLKLLNMSALEVSTLASIVQAEQSRHNDEKAKIAGLYMNRLKRGMPLESDPTLIYAIGDFSIKRVLNSYKEIDSPYNTYKNLGLPPSPINLPEISSIDAVLNYQKHNYIFMCAKADFSGYHNFSKNISMHNTYARQYHRALNKRKIMR